MPKLTVRDFAAFITPPISRQRINDLCKNKILVRVNKLIDTDDPVNAAWIAHRLEAPPPLLMKKNTQGGWEPRGTDAPTGDTSDVDENFDATDALAELLRKSDIRAISFNEVNKVQKIEAALKTRVEREHKRGDLIDRNLVRTVFARMYQIDAQELKMLGARLAPDVSGLLGIDDPVLVLMVEQRIEGEVMKSLNHIKRVINDFLVEAKAGAIG